MVKGENMGYINNIGQVLESKKKKLRVVLNGQALKQLVDELSKFGEANYKGKSEDEIKQMDYDNGFNNFTLFVGDKHENAPDFVKGTLFAVIDGE